MRGARIARTQLATVSIAAIVAASVPVASALAADPVQVSFSPTGAEQQFAVPSGVTSVHVVLVGGRGGNGGGFGHRVEADVAVIPGSTIFVEVGGNGADTGLGGAAGRAAFNGGAAGGSAGHGGGSGGGASDLRTIARTEAGSLDSRLIVAGGGGGSGGGESTTTTGVGGNAGADGAPGGDPSFSDPGLAPNGAAGGGAGIPGGFLGSAGAGGAGGSIQSTVGGGGGGGGGGYYGGGGGGYGEFSGGGAGGGGGSSYTTGSVNPSVTVDSTALPSVTITYTPGATPPDPTPGPVTGVVDADVTVPTSAACVELSTTSISFGTQRFGTQDALATPGITVTNCSGTDESLLARVSAAAGTGATWTPLDTPGTCDAGTLGIDEFHLKIRRSGNEVDPVTYLGDANKELAELTGGADADLDALLDMPCAGSAGAGQTMGMNIVFVVTEIQ